MLHHHQGEQLRLFLEKPKTITTFLSTGSILQHVSHVVLPDDGTQAQKHVSCTHQSYVCNRYCAFS